MFNETLDAAAGQARDWNERPDLPAVSHLRRHMPSAHTLTTRSRPTRSAGVAPVVFVVDQDAATRAWLEALIRRGGWHAETFACAREFLARSRVFAPSCLVLDVSLPDLDGLQVQKHVAVARADMPIIFVAGHADVAVAVQAMKAGALEFFMKPIRDDVLLGAIGHGIECSRSVRREQAEARALRDCHASLTRREREVMALVVSGLLNKQVAGELGISEITVKAHRAHAMRKMHADSFATLVTMATKLGPAPVRIGLRKSWE